VGQIRALVAKVPFRRSGRKVLGAVVAVVVLVMALGTVIVRGGNDSYESYTNGEFAAVKYTYQPHHGPVQTLCGVVLGFSRWLIARWRDHRLRSSRQRQLAPTQTTVETREKSRGVVILSQSQESWGVKRRRISSVLGGELESSC